MRITRQPALAVLASVLLAPAAGAGPQGRAQDPQPAGGATGPVTPVTPVTAAPDQVLAASRGALAKVKAASYDAVVRFRGAGSGADLLDGTSRVVLSRAEAGGWKIWIKGESLGLASPPEGEQSLETPRAFQVGYDGAMAWSLLDSEQVLLQKTIRTPPDLPAFFSTQWAWPAAAWELVAEKPLDVPRGATVSGETQQTVDSAVCDVVRVTLAPASQGAQPDSVAYFIARSDSLPRRIQRVSSSGVATLELKDLKVNTDTEPGVFSMSPPDDYMVRSADARRPSRTPTPPGEVGLPPNPGLLAAGSDAPEWKLSDPEGKQHTLSDYRGKVVLMDFWGTWCPPCRAAMPSVQALHDKYKDKGLVVLGMNYEGQPDADPAGFMRDNGYTYQLLLHAERVAPEYKVPGWPTFYVIDRQGKILWGGVGSLPAVHEQMKLTIEKALGEAPNHEQGS